MSQTATKKQSRNKPCGCGSGKKYKRCCGKSEEPGQVTSVAKGSIGNQPKIIQGPGLSAPVSAKLQNEFRKQVNPFAGIPGAELVRRDQMVLLAKLETTFGMQDLDREYFQNIIQAFTDLKHKIQKLGPCPERGPTLTDVEKQLVEFTTRAKTIGFTRTNFLTLCALRSVLGPQSMLGGIPAEIPEQPTKGEIPVQNDDAVIEQALASTGQSPAQQETKPKGDGPIEESGGGSPDADFQGESPDQVNQQANDLTK